MLPSTYVANCNHLECDAELKQVEREKVRKALRPFLQLKEGVTFIFHMENNVHTPSWRRGEGNFLPIKFCLFGRTKIRKAAIKGGSMKSNSFFRPHR